MQDLYECITAQLIADSGTTKCDDRGAGQGPRPILAANPSTIVVSKQIIISAVT